jgi:hypothetical protein
MNRQETNNDRIRSQVWQTTAAVTALLGIFLIIFPWYWSVYAGRAPIWQMLGVLFGASAGSALISAAAFIQKSKPVVRIFLLATWILTCIPITFKLLLLQQIPIHWYLLYLHPFTTFSLVDTSQAEIWHLLCLLILIAGGVNVGRHPVDHERARAIFQLGMLNYLLFLLSPVENDATILWLFTIFTFVCLVGLSTSRVASLGYSQGGKLPTLNGLWLAGLASLSGLCILVSASLSAALTFTLAPLISLLLSLAFSAVILVIGILAIPLVMLGGLFIPELIDLFRRLLTDYLNSNPLLLNRLQLIQFKGNDTLLKIANISVNGLLGLLVILILAVIYLALNARKRRSNFTAEQKSTYIPQPEKRPRPIFRLTKGQLSRLQAAERIRRVYIQLLNLCDQLNLTREPNRTPLEFLLDMQGLFSENSLDLEIITNAYMNVRYGQIPETPAEVDEIEKAWLNIRQAGKNIKLYRRQLKNEIQYH